MVGCSSTGNVVGRPGLTQQQKDQLDAAYRTTGNISVAARAAGVSDAQAYRYFKKRTQGGQPLPRGPTLDERLEALERDAERFARTIRQLRTSIR